MLAIIKSLPVADQKQVRWTRVSTDGRRYAVLYINEVSQPPVVIADRFGPPHVIDRRYANAALQHMYVWPCNGTEFAGPPNA